MQSKAVNPNVAPNLQDHLSDNTEPQNVIEKLDYNDSPRKALPVPQWLNEWELKWNRTIQNQTRKPA